VNSLLLRAKRIADDLNDERLLSCVHKTMGNCYVQKGELTKGERHLVVSSELLRRVGDFENLARNYLNLAKLHFLMGDVRGSLNYIDSEERIAA
jgi:hypothetical protein